MKKYKNINKQIKKTINKKNPHKIKNRFQKEYYI